MTLPRVMALASVLVLAGLSAALAQFPPPPNPNASPFPPPPNSNAPLPSPQAPGAAPPRASAFPVPGQQPQAQNPCDSGFLPLRAAAEKDAAAIKAASDRKASREEVCPLFKKFVVSEGKMVKFLKDNQAKCGVPPDAVKQSGLNHNKTIQIRNAVCSAGPAAATPRLGDAFSSSPMPDTRPGRGTFDTLTGNPLQR